MTRNTLVFYFKHSLTLSGMWLVWPRCTHPTAKHLQSMNYLSVPNAYVRRHTYTGTPHMGYRPKIAASVDQQAAALKQIPFLFSSVQFTNCGTCCCRVQNCRAEFSMALGAGALALLSQRTQAAASGSGRLHAANCWGLGKQTRGCCRCLWHWHYTHTLPNKHWGLCFTLHFIIKPLQTI